MTYTKNRHPNGCLFFFRAQDETRTHTILRPLPPQSSVYTNFTTCACPEQDSNLHTSRHAHLKRTRLPIPPSGLTLIRAKKKSGKRDSNSRPQPWQGCALPTELFPQSFLRYKKDHSLSLSKAGAKVLLFFDIRKFFSIFFAFFFIFPLPIVRARPFPINI